MNEKLLRNLSIIYLLLPNLLFFYSWVNVPIGVVGILALIYLGIRDIKESSFANLKVLNTKDLFVIGATTLILTLISGINGYVFQNVDYWAHNAKFYELFSYEWPIRVPQNGPVISYYYGFYVIPALISKITGTINELSIFLWTWLGLTFGIAWMYLALNKRILFVWLSLFIGDLPRVIKSILSLFSVQVYAYRDFGVENWSNFENLLWVPNQTIPTLIIGGMFVYVLIRGLNIDLLVLPIALSFWWAVFPAFVCGLFIGCLVLRNWLIGKYRFEWPSVLNNVIIPFLVCLPILIYFLSHEEDLVSGFLWDFVADRGNVVVEYLVNIGINVLLFVATYLYFNKLGLPHLTHIPFFFIILLQLLFPVYRLGEVSDFLFRGMMPLLIIIGMYLLYPLTVYSFEKTFVLVKNSGVAIFLVSMLALSSLMGMKQIFRAATVNRLTAKMNGTAFKHMPYDAYANVYEVLKAKWSQEGANQYLGDPDSFYEKYMAP